MIVTVYGPGGHDPAKPSGNVVEQYDDGRPLVADFEGLQVDRWSVPADGRSYAVARFATAEPVWFVVNGTTERVVPVDGVATLEVAAAAAGAVRIEVRDRSAVIVAEEVAR